MQQLITFIHVLVAVCVIVLVLIQRGKGSDLGAGFGSGASQTMFGSQGSTPFLVKLTGVLALMFFITSSVLSLIVGKQVHENNLLGAPNPVPITAPMQIPGAAPSPSQQSIPTSAAPLKVSKMPGQQDNTSGNVENNTQSPLPSSDGKTHN